MKATDTASFIIKAKFINGEYFDYSKVKYINAHTKVIIICPVHGEFLQTPNSHLNKNGCIRCRNDLNKQKQTWSFEKFIEESIKCHGHKYDYSKVEYKGALVKVTIICPVHGEFEELPSKHIRGGGCAKCKGFNKTTESVIEEFKLKHGDIYDYSKVEYTGIFNKVIIICPKHGEFLQSAHHHLLGTGCPVCKNSKGELSVRKYLNDNNINFISQKRFKDCRNKNPLPFDFYLPELNTCIEYDGDQHFKPLNFGNKSDIGKTAQSNLERVQLHDKIKTDYCEQNNIKLIRIDYRQKDEIDQFLAEHI